MSDGRSRRDLLGAIAAGVAVGSAGCLNSLSSTEAGDGTWGDEDDDGNASETRPGEDADSVEPGTYAEVYEAAIDSVAMVRTRGARGQGGSAFVYDGDYIVTNHHVVTGATDIDVQFVDGGWASAEIVGTDPHTDLAVLEAADRPDYARPLPVSEDDPIVGQEVIALGNPLGFDSSVSQGIVSGRDRRLPAPTGFSIPNAVQTDAALNPGNSGGPLVDLDGEVVAVISAGAGEGIGFGISAAMTRRIVPELIVDGEVDHSYVGITVFEVDPLIAEANDLEEITGVLVDDVLDDSPADGVFEPSTDTAFVDGVDVPVGGDVIRGLGGTEIRSHNDLSAYLSLETDPGDTIEATVLRDGELTTVTLTLGSRDDHEF